MRKGWMAFAAVGLVGLGFTAGQVMSQDMGGGEKKDPAGGDAGQPSPEEAAAWMKYMTPGPEHEQMAAMTGDWNASVKMWMDPKAPATESAGTAKFRMIFGGRYQVQEFSGSMMGMPFEGFGIGGFDNALKEHFGTWCDSMGTGIMLARGKADEKGVVTCTGTMTDHVAKPYDIREVITHKDKDTMIFEMYIKGGEHKEEVRMMEITYTRKK
jgi:hypothetical protein